MRRKNVESQPALSSRQDASLDTPPKPSPARERKTAHRTDKAQNARSQPALVHTGGKGGITPLKLQAGRPQKAAWGKEQKKPDQNREGFDRPVYGWSGLRGSNSLPPPWQGGALPDELNPHLRYLLYRPLSDLSIYFFKKLRNCANLFSLPLGKTCRPAVNAPLWPSS